VGAMYAIFSCGPIKSLKKDRIYWENDLSSYFAPRRKGRFVRIHEVANTIGLSTRTIQRLVKKGDFPPPIQLSERIIGWTEASIDLWMSDREKAAYERRREELKSQRK
jgi:prophage regulatory protein